MTTKPTPDVDIVQAAHADSETEALMWSDMLRDAGIRALIRSGGPGAGGWGSAASFDHYLYVRADQLDQARAILAASQAPASRPRARSRAPIVHRRRIG